MNGKAGAEELVGRISAVFDELIGVAERHGGDVLKFRGDALLLFFPGERHPERACGAASDMQWTIEEIGTAESSVGPVTLADVRGRPLRRMSFLPHRAAAPRTRGLRPGVDAGVRARESRKRGGDRGERGDGGPHRRGLARRRPRRRPRDDQAGARREHRPAAAGRGRARPRPVRAGPAPGPSGGREGRGGAPARDGGVREAVGHRRPARGRGARGAARPSRRARRRHRPRLRDVRHHVARVRHRRRRVSSSISPAARRRAPATTTREWCARCSDVIAAATACRSGPASIAARSSPATSGPPLGAPMP